MEKVLDIGGKQVRMKSTAGIITLYRSNFGEDFMLGLVKMNDKLQNITKGNEIEAIDFDFFQKSAWCMCKLADDSTPPMNEWLDQFELFDLMQSIPEIVPLLTGNLSQINDKKKLDQQTIANE